MRGRLVAEHKALPIARFPDRITWEKWLSARGGTSPGVWLKLAKKGSGKATISKADAVEAALCCGRADGQIDKFDDAYWLVRFTRRGLKSRWSQNSRETALRLVAEEQMMPAGQAQIDSARADGRRDDACASQSKAAIPDDLKAALDANGRARAFFSTLNGTNRYAIIYRINGAKTEKTRSSRIATFVAMLARGEMIYPQVGLRAPNKTG